MNRNHIDKIAETQDDRILLARLWDKIQAGIGRNILSHTAFLSPREQQMATFLFGAEPGIVAFGGYEDAERKMVLYLPDYLKENILMDGESPIVCLRASFYKGDCPTHRDFLGALMGCGISRDSVGDILVGDGFCDFFVTEEIAPYLLESLESAGRVSLKLSRISLQDVVIPEQRFSEIKDTVASLRLDSILSAGFRISRSTAGEAITADKVMVDGLICKKPDKAVAEGAKLSIRGMGKIKLAHVGGTTKKGRIPVVIHRYE